MAKCSATRLAFLIAVAVIAAAIGDPIVESVANAGLAGGHYCDNNHVSIVPALLAGGAFVLATLALRCRDTWRVAHDPQDWLVVLARSRAHSAIADLPCVFALQILTLFIMESGEQLALDGRLLGGTAWLGGPVVLSLLVHAASAAACLFAVAAFLRAMLRTLATLVRTVIRIIWLALSHAGTCVRYGRRERTSILNEAAHDRHIGGRAPPLFHAPV